jgi:hypothetical protein
MSRRPKSKVYALIAKAMKKRQQITCVYDDLYREVCPIILGHKGPEERALTYQVGGQSTGRLPDWRCLILSKVTNVELRDGPWLSGDTHSQPQGCVVDVDLDVNPDSPYKPRRSAARKGKSVSRR